MFTGIIEQTGKLLSTKNSGRNIEFEIESSISDELKIDQSLAHNGVCLTVVNKSKHSHTVVAIEETLKKTNLGFLKTGMMINLERAIRLSDRLDGHLVQGHVDTTAKLISITENSGSWLLEIELAPEYKHLVIDKGSICINGISLTVCELLKDSFKLAIIPYTWLHTNLIELSPGDLINIEFDMIAKYLYRFQNTKTENL